mmetsp:Transcript_36263/g.84847  ORF Transcript_36263/g.84847 Transcript_36263/m.84847 type:complete len:109 (+) Transcript_36263:88-414(+)
MKLQVASVLFLSTAAAWTTPTMTIGKADASTNRRDALTKGLSVASGIVAATPALANAYAVPDLAYPYEALEPFIDAPTMKIHHDLHHGTYVANINKVCALRSILILRL